ncbi:MAG TPA: lysophospholipid acyltransferase family protein [Thermoleophilaceae bacterium]|nr:lysophospholipid acyltransferase family protein [Thermoleophilaceae bacterium]
MGRDCASLDVPWARSALARGVRELILCGVLGPAMVLYTRRTVVGRERLLDLEAPVLFVANHSSHMDTPAILRALPGRWRRRTAVAAAADYFYRKRGVAQIMSLVFNTVPVRRDGGGLAPGSASHLDRLIEERWNLLLFAEGTRSRDGIVGRLRSGAAVLAAEHGLPIVPIHVSGTRDAMPRGRKWMHLKRGRPGSRRHPTEIRFGSPIRPREGESRAEVMERVRVFLAASGATTTPDERSLVRGAGPGARVPAEPGRPAVGSRAEPGRPPVHP